jgi:hypothetical protein
MDRAARQCARLLLEPDDQAQDGEVQRIKEALALLNRYGLAGAIRKLFTSRHREVLARRAEDISWFRSFCAARPTIPRCADTRLATAIVGISLLGDEEIDFVVVAVIARIDSWLARTATERIGSQLEVWWQDIISTCQHLPEASAKRVLEANQRYLLQPRATTRLGGPPVIGLWMEQGFVENGWS